MIACLKLYAPAITLVILGVLVLVIPESAAWTAVRLLILAATLAVSIREQRRLAHIREEKRAARRA